MTGNAIKSVIETGADLAESGNYEESQEFMNNVLKEFLRLDQRVKKEVVKSDQFERSVIMAAADSGASRILDELKQLNETDLRTSESINWRDSSAMKEYNEITWECGPGYGNRQGYPIIENDNGVTDDEFVMQSRDSLICPISQCIMKEPVKNIACNHSYSKDMIERLFNSGSHAIACPVSGCRGTVQRRNLVKDENLERKLSKTESRIFIK
jgi:SUMO ligase MMS21 Smc5/6 complex component